MTNAAPARRHHHFVLTSAAIAMALGPFALSAQEGPRIEEVIVSAQKREQTLSELPISISAFGESFMEERNIASLDDLARFVPNTRIDFGQGSAGDNRVTIRGLTSAARNTQPGIDPNVSFYVDGIYMQRPEQLNTELVDLERIEVLRGPQGTLYGKNSTVGAVNIITRKPSLTEFHLTADAQYGNYDALRLRSGIEVPLVEGVAAMSLSAYYADDSGLRRNTVDGSAVADVKRFGLRGKFHAQAGDDFDVTISGDYQSDKSNSTIGDLLLVGFEPAFLFLPPPYPVPTPGNVFDRDVQKTPDAERNSVDNWGGSIEMNYDLGGAVLTSLTGYRGFRSENFLDLDYSAEAFFRSGRDNQQWQLSEELRLVSDSEGPIDYLVGAYFYWSNLKSDLQTNVDDSTLLGLPPGLQGVQQVHYHDLDVNSQALFGQLTWHITDQIELTGGARIDREGRSLLISQEVGALFGGLIGFQPFPPTLFKRSENNLSLMGSVVYSIDDATNLFFTYSEGAKSGGFNGGGLSGSAISLDPSRLEFGPESARNFEAGAKTFLLDRRVSLNLSAFLIQFRDLQVTIFDAPEIRTTNAAKARSTGIELEAFAQVTDNFSLLASAGYNKAKYTDYPNGPLPGGQFGDRTGDVLPNAPEWQLAGSANYTLPVESMGGAFYVGIDALYTGRQDLDLGADPLCRQKAYTLINARAGFRTDDDRIDVQVWAKNLADEQYLVGCAQIGSALGGGPGLNRLVGTYLGIPGAPRTYGVLVRYKF
ncbi:TonB-dependent receptor [Iodidimonas sp. SYSU 1G8]|uniref:TonB-dependent receptor n=1 Tax=Iodidimonas sp. SYSU 1G8 TaxID=3133967 RepID=UPI0031FE4977